MLHYLKAKFLAFLFGVEAIVVTLAAAIDEVLTGLRLAIVEELRVGFAAWTHFFGLRTSCERTKDRTDMFRLKVKGIEIY